MVVAEGSKANGRRLRAVFVFVCVPKGNGTPFKASDLIRSAIWGPGRSRCRSGLQWESQGVQVEAGIKLVLELAVAGDRCRRKGLPRAGRLQVGREAGSKVLDEIGFVA